MLEVRACQHCGTNLPHVSRGRPQRFCSDKCRKAWGRLNGQNTPEPHPALKTQNHDLQPIDIVERICPEIRTHTPSWKRINEGTWKLTRARVTAWVMNVAPEAKHPRAWIARCGDQASNPTTLGETKALAAQMIRGLPGDREGADPIYFLNRWGAHFVRPQSEDEPYVEPVAPKGLRVRLSIMGERKLQVLGCGFRVVTIQFKGKVVLLHHNGKTAAIDRAAFKELVASNRRYRKRNNGGRMSARKETTPEVRLSGAAS
jgi:hypothetical protein